MRQSGEPSVEEILESIKQVIARDHRSTAAAEANGPGDDADDDILELAEHDIARSASDVDDAARLTGNFAAGRMRRSFAALAALGEPGADEAIGGHALDGMVREMLRPALAEWLDRNLPAMVERMVADEIARVLGRRG